MHGKKGNTAEIELVLGPGGGTIDGLCVDAAGKPVADAVVIVGQGKVSGIPGQDHIPPFPAVTRSGADGAFRAVGIPAGEQPVLPLPSPWWMERPMPSSGTTPRSA